MDLAYLWHETAHLMVSPARAASDATRMLLNNPFLPLGQTPYGRTMAAGLELFERVTRRYAKPEFGLKTTVIDGDSIPVTERIVWERPFGRVIAFDRALKVSHRPHPENS
jgi:poly(3-hydroxybutyrate) depolymerase